MDMPRHVVSQSVGSPAARGDSLQPAPAAAGSELSGCVVSIVTATLNAAVGLPRTMQSLRAQAGASFEWIVVDGGSTDGTLALLDANRDLVSVLATCTEPGVYPALNTGVELARGEWLLFIGAGDELAHPRALADASVLLAPAYPCHEMVYGRIQLIEQGSRQVVRELGMAWEELQRQWLLFRPGLPAHPEVFHHRSVFERGERFDVGYRFAADTDFMLRQAARRRFLHIPVLVTRMELGGMSGRFSNLRAISRETRRIASQYGHRSPLRHRCVEHLKLVFGDVAVRLLSEPALERLETRCRKLLAVLATWWLRIRP